MKKIILLIFTLILLNSCEFDYLIYIQHIKSPDNKYNYSLYTDDIGIGDPEFLILKLENKINPKILNVKWNPKSGINKKKMNWIKSKTIIYNYEESSYLISNPRIYLFKNKYLVFSRGGYYFTLYDINLEKSIINLGSPINYLESRKSVKIKNEKKYYENWVKKNLHNKIKDYIKDN